MAERQQRLAKDPDGGNASGPERLCAVTRQSLEPSQLIRFVLSPEGTIVADLERRLPGRGVWVGCDRRLVEKAVKANTFSKSLKSRADAPADLAERVDALMVKRLSGTLSLANKAGLAISGFEKVSAALEKGPVALVLHGAEGSADGRSKIDRKFKAIQDSRGAKAPIVDVLTIEQMSLAIGRGSVVHAALIPGGLSDRFLEEAERLMRYRSSVTETANGFSETQSEG